jgi:hypothetical protein
MVTEYKTKIQSITLLINGWQVVKALYETKVK